MGTMRDGFSKDTIEHLFKRVSLKCSICFCQTTGPSKKSASSTSVGVAAHICAAAIGGPRYDAYQTREQRRNIDNGIWLCANCARKIDSDTHAFSVAHLKELRAKAEKRAHEELAIPQELRSDENWSSLQSSQISSYSIPLKLPLDESGKKVDPVALENLSDSCQRIVSIAFGHACMTTPYDDFVYIMSLEKRERKDSEDRIAFELQFHCHITSFMWALEQCFAFFIEQRIEKISAKLKSLPGDQRIDTHPRFGKFVPHQVCRTGSNSIWIHNLDVRPVPVHNGVNTSTLLRILSIMVNCDLVTWDDADSCPDWERVMKMAANVSDGHGFSLNHFRLKRSDPEFWEYVGETH